jgi:protoheme IX farnesyltransferase
MSPVSGDVQATSQAATWPRAWERRNRGLARVREYVRLTKARLSSMVVLSAVVAYWLGAKALDPSHLLWFTLGTFLVVGGANAFNQVLEREPDSRMRRTEKRPLPAGRVRVSEAVAAALAMVSAGLAVLFLGSGVATGALGLLALAIYVLVYTPLKALTAWSTLPGAVAGAVPTLMGWTAAAGGLAPPAWCLFGVLFFWQFPHTWAIAATYREDYERAGYRALPRRGLGAATVATTLALLGASLAPPALGLTGPLYTAGAVLLGSFFLVAAARFGDGADRARAASLLAASLFYLPLVLALAAFDGRGF